MDGKSTKSNDRRINDLESTLAHQQREYDLLNQVVIEQADKIERLERRLELLESNLKSMEASQVIEERTPLDEKPPHY